MSDELELNWRTYQALIDMFRHLSDIRFKLLALVPAVSGLAIGLISNDISAFKADPLPRVLIGVLGFLVTFGIAMYDQRNSQLYNSLFLHAAAYEERLNIERGICNPRPGHTRKFFGIITIWHDRALAIIYGVVLGAWLFPVAVGSMWLLRVDRYLPAVGVAVCFATLAALAFTVDFHRLEAS